MEARHLVLQSTSILCLKLKKPMFHAHCKISHNSKDTALTPLCHDRAATITELAGTGRCIKRIPAVAGEQHECSCLEEMCIASHNSLLVTHPISQYPRSPSATQSDLEVRNTQTSRGSTVIQQHTSFKC